MKTKYILFAISIFPLSFLFGQNENPPKIESDNFFEMQATMNAHFENNLDSKEELHWRRFEHFYSQRVSLNGSIGEYSKTLQKEASKMQKQKAADRSTNGDFEFIGPKAATGTSSSYGRCVRARFHPSNPNIVYVLSSSAGLWKSFDNGDTWENLTPDLPFLFGIDLVVDQINPDKIYILTTDRKRSYFRSNSNLGVYTTDDGGETWTNKTPIANYAAKNFLRMVMSPTDSERMLIGGSDGIYKTINGWNTAEFVHYADHVWDLEYKPGSSDTMYASYGVFSCGLLRSTDGGDSFTPIVDSNLGFLDSMNRAEISVSPDKPNYVYVFASNGTHEFIARSTNSGVNGSWTIRSHTVGQLAGGVHYNFGISVDPNNAEKLYVFTVGMHRSDDGGLSWTHLNDGYTHWDHHDLVFNNGYIYDLNDGGVGRSENGGNFWVNKTAGIEVYEAYSISGTPQNTSLYYSGSQDEGLHKLNIANGDFGSVWSPTGDAMTFLIDPTNQNKLYQTPQYGGLRYSFDAGSSWHEFVPVEPEFGQGVWVSPYTLATNNPNDIFIGKDTIYLWDASSMEFISLFDPEGTPDNRDLCERIAQGTGPVPGGHLRLYVISDNKLYIKPNYSFDFWGAINAAPVGNMSDVIVNPNNKDELWLTYGGTDENMKVYHSTDAGAAWTNISGSLPNVPVITIKFHDEGAPDGDYGLYIGTDLGVFYSSNSGPWVYFSNNMPSVPVSDLYINTASNELFAATIGRGIWKSDLFTTCPSSITILEGDPSGPVHFNSAWINIQSSHNYSGVPGSIDVSDPAAPIQEIIGSLIKYKAGNHIDLLPGFRASGPSLFEARIGDCFQPFDSN